MGFATAPLAIGRRGCSLEGWRKVISGDEALSEIGVGAASVAIFLVEREGLASLGFNGAFGRSEGAPKMMFGNCISDVMWTSGGDER
ncbi:MAG: hypothetical protein WA673_18725 [Candidatus Acidiferrales bacterium]